MTDPKQSAFARFMCRLRRAIFGSSSAQHDAVLDAIKRAHLEVIVTGERLQQAIGESETRLREEVRSTTSSITELVAAMRNPKYPPTREA